MIEFIRTYRHYLYLLLALFANAVLVLSIIGERSIWLDEAMSWSDASLDHDNLINKIKRGGVHPPLYYIFLSWWIKSFGTSEIALRFPSYIFGSITIILAFNISKKYFDNFTTGLTLVLVSLYPFLIYYQQEARMYTMMLMFLMLTLNFLLNLVNNEYRILSTILVTVFSIAAMYSHYYGIFGVISLNTGLVLYCIIKKYWQRLILLTFGLVSSFIAFYPWIKTINAQSQGHPIGGIHEMTFYQMLNFMYHSLSFAQSFNRDQLIMIGMINLIFVISLFAFIYTNIKLVRRFKNNTPSFDHSEKVFLYLETIFFTNYLGPVLISITKVPLGYSIYNTRYFIFPLVLFKIIIAYCLNDVIKDTKFSKVKNSRMVITFKLFKITKKQHLRVLLLIILILFQVGYNVNNSPKQKGFRELVNFIEYESTSYIPIIVEPFYNKSPLNYYLNETWQQYLEYVYLNDTFLVTLDRLQSKPQMWFTYSISKSDENFYELFFDNGYIDPYYDRIEFGQLILLKLISKAVTQELSSSEK